MKKVLETIGKMLIVLVAGAAFLVMMMTLVYKLPTDKMAAHVVESEDVLKSQNDEVTALETGFYDYYDTGTNVIILHEIIYPNTHSALRDAMLNPTADYFKGDLLDWIDNLIRHASEREYGEDDYQTYPRYWHGYLVVLKPLFIFFNLKQIYIINVIVLGILNLGILIMLYKRMGNYAMAYLLFGLIMNPLHIAFSFQLSAVFYTMSITMLLLLSWDRLEEEDNLAIRNSDKVYFIFLFDGMLLAAIDFLTYPLVGFAIVLLTYLMLDWEKTIKHEFIECIKTGLSFLLGYGGFWALKWVAATLLTDENVISDGINNTMHRVGAKEMEWDALVKPTPMMSIEANIDAFLNLKTVVIFAILLVFVFIVAIIRKRRLRLNTGIMFATGLVAISPFAWLIVVYNHCAFHPHLEWRELGILFYAVAVFMISLTEEEVSE